VYCGGGFKHIEIIFKYSFSFSRVTILPPDTFLRLLRIGNEQLLQSCHEKKKSKVNLKQYGNNFTRLVLE